MTMLHRVLILFPFVLFFVQVVYADYICTYNILRNGVATGRQTTKTCCRCCQTDCCVGCISSGRSSSSNVFRIIGGIASGVSLFIAICVYCCCRRKKARQRQEAERNANTQANFNAAGPSVAVISHGGQQATNPPPYPFPQAQPQPQQYYQPQPQPYFQPQQKQTK